MAWCQVFFRDDVIEIGLPMGYFEREAIPYSMSRVTWTTLKFNRNQLETVSAYVM